MSWLSDCKSAADELTRDQRQEIIDKFRSGDYTIGQIREIMKLSLEAVCGTINENIEDAQFIRSEVIR